MKRENRRDRWAVLAAGMGAQSVYSAVTFGVAVLAPELRVQYGLSLSEVGLALASLSFGQMVALLPLGLLADRFGEGLVTAAGLAASGAAIAGVAFAPGFGSFLVLLALAGLCGAGVNAATGRAIMGWFSHGERGLALGVRQTAAPMGGAAGAFVLPAIIHAGGTRWAFLVLAAACSVGAGGAAVWLREPTRRDDSESHSQSRRHPLRDGRIWRLSSAGALLLGANTAMLGFAVLFLQGARGFSDGGAAAVLGSMHVLGGALRIAAGRWSDLVGSRLRPMRLLTCAVALSLGLAAALVHAPAPLLIVAMIVAGGLSMSWNGLAFTAAAEVAGRDRSGAALGLQQTALAVSGFVTPIVFALLVDAMSWGVGFALAALCPLAGLYLVRGLDV